MSTETPEVSALLTRLLDDIGSIGEDNCPKEWVTLARRLEKQRDLAIKERDADRRLRLKLIELLHKHGQGETDEKDGERIAEMVNRIVSERDEARAEAAELREKLKDSEACCEDYRLSMANAEKYIQELRGRVERLKVAAAKVVRVVPPWQWEIPNQKVEVWVSEIIGLKESLAETEPKGEA